MKKIFFVVLFLAVTISGAYGTVSSSTARVKYTCNGSTTIRAYPFQILTDADMKAVVISALGSPKTLTLNDDYSVTGAGNVNGGTVVLSSGSLCPTGSTLTLLRDMDLTQETDYVDGQGFSAESVETALDKMAMNVQQLSEELSRAVRLPAGSTGSSELPSDNRASKVTGFDSAGNPALYDASATDLALIVDAVHRIDTIADLRLFSGGSAIQAVQVMGYYTVGDGGGGPVRRWDSASTCTDDGGACLDPVAAGAGRWVWPDDVILIPEEWGAVGDGTTDDSIPLRKLTAAATDGSTIRLTAGKTYLFASTDYTIFVFDGKSNIVFDGQNATIKVKDGVLVGKGWGLYFLNCNDIVVRDLVVNGNRENVDVSAGDGASNGVSIVENNNNILVQNVHAYDMATDGLYIGIPGTPLYARSHNITVENCTFERSRRNNMSVAGAYEVTLQNNKYIDAGATVGVQAGTDPKTGLDIEPNGAGADYENNTIRILNNSFSGSITADMGTATAAQGTNQNIFIDGNTFNTVSTANSLLISGKVDNNIHVTRNNFVTAGGAILSSQATSQTNILISHNKFHSTSTAVYLINIQNSGKIGWVISNNVFNGIVYLLNFTPSNGAATDNYIHNNRYFFHTQCDVAATNFAAITLARATASNELLVRTLTYKLRYTLASTVLADNINVQGSTAVIYDTAVGFELPTSLQFKRGANVLEYNYESSPASGTWAVGSRVNNTYFQGTGAYSYAGWAYLASGAVWKPFGVIIP